MVVSHTHPSSVVKVKETSKQSENEYVCDALFNELLSFPSPKSQTALTAGVPVEVLIRLAVKGWQEEVIGAKKLG
jgi:hypothetical protein